MHRLLGTGIVAKRPVLVALGFVSCVMLGAMANGSASAAANLPSSTDVAASELGPDFELQGEFLGEIATESGRCSFGLQAVAGGNEKFSARGYYGGLPGNGWNGAESVEWNGSLADGVVMLNGPSGKVLIDRVGATLTSADGNELGRLQRVQRTSKTIGATPPVGATILFDGTDVSAFENGEVSSDGWLKAGATTKAAFGDFRLHLEFQIPFMAAARGQGRGNSGVYIQQRYEVQILDSFGLPGLVNGCGALYKQQEPLQNMSFPPLRWQTYDIDFQAARWDACGNKIRDARITVLHNGIRVHDDYAIVDKTGAGKPETPEDRPLRLQFHGNPVCFRNVWLVAYDGESVETSDTCVCADSQSVETRRARRLRPLRAGRLRRF